MNTPDKLPDNVIKFPANLDKDAVMRAAHELIRSKGRVALSDREYERDEHGSLRRITPKPGEKGPPVNWRERAMKAESYFIGLVEERKKIQNLILEAMMKIDAEGFKSAHGDLVSFSPYCEIKAFAKGVPHITRPPLETMRLDGVRAIKRMIRRDKVTEIYLECAHEIQVQNEDVPKLGDLKMNSPMLCNVCLEVLKQRGMYAEEKRT